MSRSKPPLGQHFLIDQAALGRIVDALELRSGDWVLEIGPGRGALTDRLANAVDRLAAVELDRLLAARLRRRFAESRLVLFRQDALKLDLHEVLEALGAPPEARLTLAGNLPYGISKPIVQKLIRARHRVDRAVLMFQREVAARLTAVPGHRAYGPLGILAGWAFRIERLFDLPPRAFSPPPEVVSTVTHWVARPPGPRNDQEEARLRTVLAACFARRRRTLRNNLRAAVGNDARVDRLLTETGIDGELRAEVLPPSL